MATVKHKFVSAVPDSADPSIVKPSNWNDSHVVNGGTAGQLLVVGTDGQTIDTVAPPAAGQPHDVDLDAIAALATNGLIVRTGSGTAATSAIAGVANEVSVTNGDGVAGNPTIGLPTALTFTGKTVTGGSFASPTMTGVMTGAAANFSGTLTFGTGTITALTQKLTPDASGDYIIIYDAAGTAVKKATVGSVGAAGASGVTSLNGLTGGLTIAAGNTDLSVSAVSPNVTISNNGLVSFANAQTLTAGQKQQASANITQLRTLRLLTSGSGTYTSPSGCVGINVRMVGGGGGGYGSGTGYTSSPGNGGNSVFGAATARGGVAGSGNLGGDGGTVVLGGLTGFGFSGAMGGWANGYSTGDWPGGFGAGTMFTSCTQGAARSASYPPPANTGGGGAGGSGSAAATVYAAGGGGSGAYIELKLAAGSYAYAVGAAGTAGAPGTSGFSGAAGASGVIIIEEYYI